MEECGRNSRRDKGRARYEGGGMLRQLSCEEANGLSSPSHAHIVFSDGHSSSETHIGLATGTEPQSADFNTAVQGLVGICQNSG